MKGTVLISFDFELFYIVFSCFTNSRGLLLLTLGVSLIDALFTECDHVLPRSWDDSSFKMFRVYVLHLTRPKFKTDMSI